MAKHVVELSPRAAEDLQVLSRDVAARMLKKLRTLEEDPFPRGDTVKVLRGFDIPTYRLRIGDYRAVYRIRRNDLVRRASDHPPQRAGACPARPGVAGRPPGPGTSRSGQEEEARSSVQS